MSRIVGLGSVLALGFFAASAAAQSALSASAGAASYDLSGVGTSATAAVRFELPVAPRLHAQIGTGFFWYGDQVESQVAMLLPEAGVLARLPIGIPLYLGAGAGRTVGLKGQPEDDFTVFGAAGLEFEDRAGWAVRPELRVRAVDPWAGTIADFTVGIRRRFGG